MLRMRYRIMTLSTGSTGYDYVWIICTIYPIHIIPSHIIVHMTIQKGSRMVWDLVHTLDHVILEVRPDGSGPVGGSGLVGSWMRSCTVHAQDEGQDYDPIHRIYRI